MAYYVKKFDSLYSYNEHLRRGTVQSAFEKQKSQKPEEEPVWYGTESYQEAEYFLLNGNHELAEGMRNKMQNVSSTNEGYFRNSITQPKLVRGVAGYRVNIGAFLAGSEKCMLRKVRQKVEHPVINIIYNNGATGDVDPEKLTDVNSRVLKAIQILELYRGIRVNLYVSEISRSYGSYAGPIVRIKDSDTIMDTEKIAYPLISPSMLRRQKFRFFEVFEGLPRHFADGYGSSVDDGAILLQVAKEVNLKPDVCLTYYEAKNMTDEQLLKKFTANNRVS